MAVAGAMENRPHPCSEATGEWSWANCEGNYDTIARSADKCCGGGPSYCPAPQLCEDPATYNGAAEYAGPECYSYITANFTAEMCTASSCYVYTLSGEYFITEVTPFPARAALSLCACYASSFPCPHLWHKHFELAVR